MSVVASVPTSFEGPFGKILYKIRAFIDTPRFSKDYKTQKPFYLLNVLNLNELPDIEVRPGYVGKKKIIIYILYYMILYYIILALQFLMSALLFPATQLCCDNKKV